ncbi:type III-A CRISPR-associated RAMP protein Csm3 [Candidatus Aciduliprofundum boonei]|uniref:CRISPR system Cms endoribonuclease Csm3 n=1 Tax=Aciduliprofundum boonei (strain DSM 19572 / T469) TaxID=439481 RepID=B5IHF4_ACIB4|nr:type III-A CRISPR-associated RAMP protein Csm3 [Candidatus Aciduliprofundum boonei]ADD08835.1 CRISPR-associated RAMP protein, Csm3 family [Aciduliprofundum boonei T469]EDY34305.1 CRISPR-associated RAMP protein, Csm3 family [Aciduliprofundum boonei T469]HII55527.1 type III-A CRISPR-associated RAMP protein Csm3 [Candidatus Aciduliprofundum boonei]
MGKKFVKNLVIRGKIKLITGLHIGGLKETVEIGGMDNPVITTYKMHEGRLIEIPYIPGSSLKGKIRSLLEITYADITMTKDTDKCPNGYVKIGNKNCIKYSTSKANIIPMLFGIPAETSGFEENLSRVIVRDAYPTEDTIRRWKEYPDIVGGTEVKMENAINRLTSAANPRPVERIPAESEFTFEIVLSIYEGDNEKSLLSMLLEGMRMLEDNYLGGFGSRGYGKLSFKDLEILERDVAYYEKGSSEGSTEGKKIYEGGSLDDLLVQVNPQP